MLDAHHKSASDTMLVIGMIFEVEMDSEQVTDIEKMWRLQIHLLTDGYHLFRLTCK